jgi:phosphatidylglycerol lysyltransferase
MLKNSDEEKFQVAEALRRYGYQSQSYNILLNDKSYFFSPEGISGVIAYVVRSGVALGAGDPVCDPADLKEFVVEFRKFCQERKWRCCFQGVTDQCEAALSDLGFGTLKISEEPIFDLRQLSWAGGAFRDLRRDIRRAQRQGMYVTEYKPLEKRNVQWETQMEEMSRIWREFKGSGEFSFLIGKPGLDDPGDRKYFLALKEDELQAFVVCTPIYARNGIYFDLMRRQEIPLGGTAQLLITEAFQLLKNQGYEMASLGAVPLSTEEVNDPDMNLIIEIAMEFAFNHLGYFHHYKPLYQFKDQFGPTSWEARYLAFWPPRFNPLILYAVLKAYDPEAVSGNLKRQLQAAWKGIKWLKQAPGELLDRLLDVRRS